ncbi:MAG TPA: helix-turn-helix domain-containing protein [Longimicrobium sp.]
MNFISSVLPAPIQPTDEDVRVARESASRLGRMKRRGSIVTFVVTRGADKGEFSIPGQVFDMLVLIIDEVADGNSVAVAPLDRELSTQKAADFLNVSRPYLVKLLESGKMPFRKVGTHRRVRYADVLRYRARLEADAEHAYSELVSLSQDLGLYE